MKIKTTITLEHTIPDSEVAEFKERVLQYIADEDCEVDPEDISDEAIEEFLAERIPDMIEDQYKGYCSRTGIIKDEYFGTISFDYGEEDIDDLVKEMVDLIAN